MAVVRLLYAVIFLDFVSYVSAQAIEVRLEGNVHNHSGRLEVLYNGQWGTVCDDLFDSNDASVACFMLGQGRNGSVVRRGVFSYGHINASIWLSDLQCVGNETSLADCARLGWGENNCSHSEDVSISCQPNPLAVRVTGSGSSIEGRLELYSNGRWGAVSNRYFDYRDAAVACHMLGFERRGLFMRNYYGSVSSPGWMFGAQCTGTEESLLDCRYWGWAYSKRYRYRYDYYRRRYILSYNYRAYYDYDVSIYCPPGNCTEILDGCTTIWNLDVRPLYTKMLYGTLQPDELQAVCSNWSMCVTNVNKTGCTFSDLYRLVYYNHSYSLHSWYSRTTQRLLPYLCDIKMPEYLSYEKCYDKPPLENDTAACDHYYSRAIQYPYGLLLTDCDWRSYVARCFGRAWFRTCNSQEIGLQASRLYLYIYTYVKLLSGTCTYNDTELLDLNTLNQFREEEYISCVSQEPVMTTTRAYTMFDYIQKCSYSPSTLARYCSDWWNFTSCLDRNEVTFDDMHRYLSPYSSWRYKYYYNRTIDSYNFFCTNIEDYKLYRQFCPPSGSICYAIVSLKGYYPYKYIYGSCSRTMESKACKYHGITSAGNETAAGYYAHFYQKNDDYWNTASCGINESVIVNSELPDDANCSMYRYLKCLVPSAIKYKFFQYSNVYFSNILLGRSRSSTIQTMCRSLPQLINCLGCKPTQSIFPTKNMTFERFYSFNVHTIANYLTPLRLHDLCLASEEEYAEYVECFKEFNMYYTFNTHCLTEAQTRVSEEPGYDYCNLFKYWGQCFYQEVSTNCSIPAADYVMRYLVDGWKSVLSYRYDCEFGCEYSPCVSELAATAANYSKLFLDGQLTTNELTTLCTMTNLAVSCIASTVQSLCPNKLKYLSFLRDVSRFVCSSTEQQAYLTNQACYSGSSAVTLVRSYFTDDPACDIRLPMLLNISNIVTLSCSAAAAMSVISYTDYLKVLTDLEELADSNCTTVLYPSVSAPKFAGPFRVQLNYDGHNVTDFTFTCTLVHRGSDRALFDVALTFDGVPDENTVKTTTPWNKTIVFNSTDLQGHFGTEVSCAVRSYWPELPEVKSGFVQSVIDYFVGIKCSSENMVNGMIRIKESDPPSKVFLTPTVPVSCPPCTMTLGLARSVGLDLSECSVTFSGVDGEPDASQTVMIEPMNTYGSSSRVARIEFSPITTDPVSPWDGYTPAHCPVLIVDAYPSRCCRSDGDPRMSTFDRMFYNIYFTGDFVLWRSKNPAETAEVHVRLRRCFIATGSCICAVVFREGNNVLGINACQNNRPPALIKYLVDPLQPADIFISNDGLSYVIKMPSGRRVSARANCRIFTGSNCRLIVWLCVHTGDFKNSEGLCGNYNNAWRDDLIPKDWTTIDFNCRAREPISFVSSYMVKGEASLINAHIYPPSCVPILPLPQAQCECQNPTVCENSTPTIPDPSGASIKTSPYVTPGTYQCTSNRRKKRDTSSSETDDDDDEDMLPVDEIAPPEPVEIPGPDGLHPNDTWPTPSGITLDMANFSCVTPIHSLSIFGTCDEYTKETRKDIIESCILDIQITENVNESVLGIDQRFTELCMFEILASDNRTVEEALAAYNESLFSGTDEEPADVLLSPAIRQILQATTSQVCPGQPACTGQGTCSNSVCTCNTGFTGADCSILADAAPFVRELISEPTCRLRVSRCNSARFIVENFDVASSVVCKAESDAGTYHTSADITSAEVRCRLPVFPLDGNSTLQLYNWTISVSRDNSTWSNSAQVLVYDPLYVTCSDDGNQTTCLPSQEGMCLMSGRIYEFDDSRSESKPCWKCLPNNSVSAWTWDTAECGDLDECTELENVCPEDTQCVNTVGSYECRECRYRRKRVCSRCPVTKKMEKCKKSLYSKRNRRFCKKAKRKMSGKLKCCKKMKVCEDRDDSDDSDDSSQPLQPSSTPSSTTTSGDNGRKWVCDVCPVTKKMERCKKVLYYKRHRRFCNEAKGKMKGEIKCCDWVVESDEESDDDDDDDDDFTQLPQLSSTLPSTLATDGDGGNGGGGGGGSDEESESDDSDDSDESSDISWWRRWTGRDRDDSAGDSSDSS